MEQYIPKSALVAEIKKLKKEIVSQDSAAYTESYIIGAKHTLNTISDILDTIEVKEVDLDSERRKYLTEHFNVYEDGFLQSKRSNLPLDTYDVIKLAKHFFELGIKVAE